MFSGGGASGGGTPPPGSGIRSEELFTPTLGQTAFVLSATPADNVDLFVNHLKYVDGVDYSVSGATVTWLDVQFTLSPTDSVEIQYVV